MSTTVPAKRYHILSATYLLLRDVPEENKQLLFHVKTGDYFAMLATALGFVEEALQNTAENRKEAEERSNLASASAELELLRKMKKDLIFLHSRYEIHEKAGKAAAREEEVRGE